MHSCRNEEYVGRSFKATLQLLALLASVFCTLCLSIKKKGWSYMH